MNDAEQSLLQLTTMKLGSVPACPTIWPAGKYLKACIVWVLGAVAYVTMPLAPLSADDAPADKLATAFHGPLTPAESLAEFQLHPGLKMELVAAEPQVIDPVAIAFDEQGRMWVVEMRDYPNGPAENEPPSSRIRVLQDLDNDGQFETSTIFADKLLFANGIQPWDGGLIVTLAGSVVYFRDTDGDLRADVQETWYTGFQAENPQLRANHPTLGIDNQIYVANGLRGGVVSTVARDGVAAAEPVSISGMDFRFDPRTGQCEAVSGVGQFGLTFDDFGNRFVCSNRNPCKHILLENRYIKRNPLLAVRDVATDVAASGSDSRVFALSQAWTTSTLHAGQFTAACGVSMYGGNGLPTEFFGNVFVCEPTGNLVHREIVQADGATFKSQPAREGVEFLASRDTWFRPVNLTTGPDGALYVVDMYRAVIEHPQFMPTELKNRSDLTDGSDRGRIYRIVGGEADTSLSRLDALANGELVGLLEHANAWQRQTAARLLLERRDPAVVELLASLAEMGRTPQSRVHALWLLDAHGSVSPERLKHALADPSPRVREHAVRLTEAYLLQDDSTPKSQAEELVASVRKLADDDDPRVRFQVALSLGTDSADATIDALARIAIRDAHDRWTRTAVETAISQNPVRLLDAVFQAADQRKLWSHAGVTDLIFEVCQLVGGRKQIPEIDHVMRQLTHGDTSEVGHQEHSARLAAEFAAFHGLAAGATRRGLSVSKLTSELSPEAARIASDLTATAVATAGNREATPAIRESALSVVERASYEQAGATLQKLAADNAEPALRERAIRILGSYGHEDGLRSLMQDVQSQTPAVRQAILNSVVSTELGTGMLLDALEAKTIPVTALDAAMTNRLTRHRNPALRGKAAKILAAAIPADRKKVLADYRKVLELPSDPRRGREVFVKNCTVCHQIGDVGVNVAPDIADSRTRTPDALLTDILDPNRAIDNNYFSYTVVRQDGRVLTGIIITETATSITLKQQENKVVTLLRDEIDEMHSNGVSLMPVGLEKNIPPQQMADLISFIKNWRYLDGSVPIEVGP